MTNNRSNFTSKIGFILAAAGSAVGLGNIWRFPYLVAQYGGGTFLLCYIILAVTFGFALMTAEIALGRKTRLSAIGAFSALNKKYRFIGVLAALVPILILPYYSVDRRMGHQIFHRLYQRSGDTGCRRHLFFRIYRSDRSADLLVRPVYGLHCDRCTFRS